MKRPAISEPTEETPPTRKRAIGTDTSPAGKGSRAGGWCEHGSLHVCSYGGSAPSHKVAAFDLDDTLIATKSGKTFAEGPSDWRWWHPKVPEKLKELASAGHRLVVVSNQSGIGKGTGDKAAHRQKVDAIQKELGLPLLVLVATGDDNFRKPRTGTFTWLSSKAGGGVAPDASGSFFVGDAAGRAELKKPKVKKDFSDSDLKFALNLGLPFWTPDRFFLGPDADRARPVPTSFSFDPRLLGAKSAGRPLPGLGPSGSQEVVVLVGPPGAGKSSMAASHFGEYERVNQDTLKTKEKCIKACVDALRGGRSVVVDNQNRDRATRKAYVDAAKAAGLPARAVLLDVPKELCFHLNAYRALNPSSPEHRGADRVPSMIIHAYFKSVDPPTPAEGFVKVVVASTAQFVPKGSAEDIALLKSFLVA